MIRIKRAPCPASLAKASTHNDLYKRKQVVEALWVMQRGKCCYSERFIPKYGHEKAVEHFHPKAVFTAKQNDWENLLLVCPQCNGRKRDQFPELLTDNENEVKVVYLRTAGDGTPALIDPSAADEDDPEEHLTYVLDNSDPLYGQVTARGKSVRGAVTIKVTGIDDPFFLRLRKYRLLEVLEGRYIQLLKAKEDAKSGGDPDAGDTHLEWFRSAMDESAEFAGLTREFAREKRLDRRFGLTIPGRS